MGRFDHIQRCIELGEDDIAIAAASREATRALLDHFARIAHPGEGAAKLLLALARLATNACDWLDGDLRIELGGDAEVTVVEVMTELGAGMRERVFPPFTMFVPIDEFLRAITLVPHLVQPLLVITRGGSRLVLSATAELRRSSMPPPMIEIPEAYLVSPQALAAPRPVDLERPSRNSTGRKSFAKPPPARVAPSSAKQAIAPPIESEQAPSKSAHPDEIDSGWGEEDE